MANASTISQHVGQERPRSSRTRRDKAKDLLTSVRAGGRRSAEAAGVRRSGVGTGKIGKLEQLNWRTYAESEMPAWIERTHAVE